MRADFSLTSNLLDAIASAKQTQNDAVFQMSSGKRIRDLADDPAASAQIVGLNESVSALDAFTAGGASVRSRLSAADTALSTAVQLATRAVSLGVEGATGTASSADRGAISSELESIHDQLLSLANSQVNGRYLFSGEADQTPAFQPTNGTVTYQGSASVAGYEISPGVTIPGGAAGSALFGANGSNIFDAISGLAAAFRANTTSQSSQSAVENSLQQLIQQRVVYGSAMTAIDNSTSANTAGRQSASDQASKLESADMASAAAKLSQAQLVQSAASAAFSRVTGMSLFDYMGPTSNP